MKQQDDLQKLIDATRDYCKEHKITEQDEMYALKALYNLVPRDAAVVSKKSTNKNRNTKKEEGKKDFMDMWIETIKGGM